MSAGRADAGPAPAAGRRAAYELYFTALCGRRVTVEPVDAVGAPAFPDTHTTVRLPAYRRPVAGVAADDWHRVALAHRALHYELGTFELALGAAGDERLRVLASEPSAHAEGRGGLEVFLAAFADRGLALLVFELLEDVRVDAALARRYPGLAPALRRLAEAEATRRPALGGLPPRSAACELLCLAGLGAPPERVPIPLAAVGAHLLGAVATVTAPAATVATTAVATGRVYALLTRLPNLGTAGGATAPLTATGPYADDGAAPWPERWPEPPRTAIEGDDVLTVRVAPVAWRDELAGRVRPAPTAGAPGQQAVFRWSAATGADGAGVASAPAARRPGPPEPLPHEHHDVARPLHRREEGALEPAGPRSFVYPEWDGVRGGYRQRWCRVVEQRMPRADAPLVADLRLRYLRVLHRLRALVETSLLHAFTVERRVTDGDDVDYDALVDALVDTRAGASPTDAVHRRLVRAERDVVVGLLVDLSSSTGERVRRTGPQRVGAPDGGRPPRILDMELLAALLCMTALDLVGDPFAAWGFSGTGRGAVVLPVLKDLHERFDGRVLARAAAVKPGHATRMGAAVRHATARLRTAPHATKLLLVVSDGRPYDVDYGQEYGEDAAIAYAVADTGRAVEEARAAGVRPFLLTVDPAGDDYLRDACAGDYEVLDEVTALPQRLTRAYRDLSAGRSRRRRSTVNVGMERERL